jgi:hypothetical protein
MTEFGAADKPAIITTIADLNDKSEISWTEWAFNNNPVYIFPTINGKPVQDPQDQGIIRDTALPYIGKNVVWDRLQALTRIYPKFIAGTKSSFTYNTQGAFDLSYIANEVQKDQLANITVIIVPNYSSHKYNILTSNATLLSVQKNQLSFVNTSTAQVVNIQIIPR